MAYSIVLLVDPDKDARKNLEKVLEPQFKLVSVKNSTAASKAIKRNNVVLIVSETDLGPKSAPFEFLEQLKSDANTAAIPIIAVSENDEPQRRIQSLSIGVAHHLRKPVDAGVLLTLANATIKSNQRTVMAPKRIPAKGTLQPGVLLRTLAQGIGSSLASFPWLQLNQRRSRLLQQEIIHAQLGAHNARTIPHRPAEGWRLHHFGPLGKHPNSVSLATEDLLGISPKGNRTGRECCTMPRAWNRCCPSKGTVPNIKHFRKLPPFSTVLGP